MFAALVLLGGLLTPSTSNADDAGRPDGSRAVPVDRWITGRPGGGR